MWTSLPEKSPLRGGLTRNAAGASVAGRRGNPKAKPRPVAIPLELSEVLSDHIASLPDRSEDGFLFPDAKGGLIRYSNWRRRVWLPALEATGLDSIRPTLGFHNFRRLNVTQLHAHGVGLRILMNRTGHKTARLALEVYAQRDAKADKAAAETIGSYVFGSMSHVSRTDKTPPRQPDG